MKKIFAVILTLALLSMATVTAFADNIDTIGEAALPRLRALMLREAVPQRFTV